MPIADSELNKPANTHLLRPATETVLAALRAWRGTPDPYEWWWLVIEHADQHFTAIRFGELRDALAHDGMNVHMNTLLGDLPPRRDNPVDWERPFPGVVTPTVVDQATIGTARALRLVQDSPARVLVVLADGAFKGILAAGERTFAFADQPLLDMLEQFEAPGDSDTHILPPRPGLPLPSEDS